MQYHYSSQVHSCVKLVTRPLFTSTRSLTLVGPEFQYTIMHYFEQLFMHTVCMCIYLPETTMASFGPQVWKRGIIAKFEELQKKWPLP